MLHLAASNRYYFEHVIGGGEDRRNRDAEFAARGSHSKHRIQEIWAESVALVDHILTELNPSRMVLPFANHTGDPAQDYLSEGLTDELITELGRLRPERLGVIARTSALRYQQTRGDASRIAHELGVT